MSSAATQLRWDAASVSIDDTRAQLARARLTARSWSDAIAEAHRIGVAALFARTAIESFAREVAPGLALSAPVVEPCGKLDAGARRLATEMGRLASALPPTEGCHALTSIYPSLLPSKARGRLGAFYTPPALARRLVDLATEEGVDWSSARVLDPASGGGAFLFECAMRMRTALDDSNPFFVLEQLGSRLSGFELDPHAASLSQAALEVLFSDAILASRRPAPRFVGIGDTLERSPEERFDLVLGNPPYGRIKLSSGQRERFARSLYGHANLYGVFTDIALRWARPGGLIAYLTPTSVLGGQYYKSLRRLLATEAPPIAIDFVNARAGVFEDVLQETLLALYRKGGKQRRVQVHYLHVANDREAELTRNGKVSLPIDPTAPWLAPREPRHVKLIQAGQAMSARLADWGYEVSTGPLVWNRHKPQLRDSAGRGTKPLIWAEVVTGDGRFVFRADRKNHAPYFAPLRRDGWLVVDRACVLVQRTTAKEQSRRLIAAELPQAFVDAHAGVVVENHLNMVRPSGKPLVSPAAVAAVLNSDAIDQLFRCISGSVAVSAFELGAIPLPAASAMASLERMVMEGASRATIEKELRRLYGLDG